MRNPYIESEYKPRDPHNPFDDRALGLAMLGSVFFCATTGTGVGIFFEHPEAGLLIGGVIGILAGIWLVPALFRDWQDCAVQPEANPGGRMIDVWPPTVLSF